MKHKIILFTLFSLQIIHQSFAQISTNEKPVSFQLRNKPQVPVIYLPEFDAENLDNESEAVNEYDNTLKPLRFAKRFDIDIPLKLNAICDTLQGRGLLWRLTIASKGAYSLNFTLSNYELPKGAKLFFYSRDKKHVAGAFTSKNNKLSKKLNIAPIPGDVVTVEYFEPISCRPLTNLTISSVGHDYKNVFQYLSDDSEQKTRSGYCQVNINCNEGIDWQNEKRAVAKIIVDNSDICTGTIVNNINEDGVPYFITAHHCIKTYHQAEKTLFMFHYESASCYGIFSLNTKTLSGSELRATSANLDFSLVELTTVPPARYNIYYAGWNVADIPAESTVCIHHPDGDLKKIAVDDDPPVTGNYGSGLDEYAHWRVKRWEVGSTEKGSSGSGLFNQNHQLVGFLSGGQATCASPINDYYVKTARLWNDYDDPFRQIKTWLDPDNTGAIEIEGYDPNAPVYDRDAKIDEIISPQKTFCAEAAEISPEIIVKNNGLNPISGFTLMYSIDSTAPQTIDWNGTLNVNEKTTITFPEIQVGGGDHNFVAYIATVDGVIDQDNTNDTLTTAFTVKNGTPVAMRLTTDEFGNETTWELKDIDSTILYSGGPYSFYMQTINKEFCLYDGYYSFTIKDMEEDGICCANGEGSYSLINSISLDTIMVGGTFSKQDFREFWITSNNSIAVPPYIAHKVFPNPTSNYITILTKHNEPTSIKIFDLYGKEIMHVSYDNGSKFVLNLHHLQSGIYIVKVNNRSSGSANKILITK